MLTGLQAWWTAAFFAVSYVGSLYLRRVSRVEFAPTPVFSASGHRVKAPGERWRDDQSVIRARLLAVSLSSLLTLTTTAYFVAAQLSQDDGYSIGRVISYLGFRFPPSLWTFLLAPILYIGPLYTGYLSSRLPGQRRWSVKQDVQPVFTTWLGARNYLIAPFTEEITFRVGVVSVMRLAEASGVAIVFGSPLWFGVAHLHHAWETYSQYGRTKRALQQALVMCLVQLCYTTAFGWFAAYLYLRTGSILPPLASHVFCNVMGLPMPGMYARAFPRQATAIWGAHLVGIGGFVVGIYWLGWA